MAHAKTVAGDVLRFLLVFVLAFSLTFVGQGAAWALSQGSDDSASASGDGVALLEGEDGAGDGGAGAQDPDTSGGTGGTGGNVTYTVEGITLYYEDLSLTANWAACANSWEAIPAEHGKLTSKGETLTFRVQLIWSDGSTSFAEDTSRAVSYSVDDPSIATVDVTGTVRALSNGTVTLTATCEGHSVSYMIDVTGQNNELYVESIVIVDENGDPYDEQSGIQVEDLNLKVDLYARVTVVDPATGQKTDYFTSDGSLSSQTGGAIADLSWSVSDSNLGHVDETTGSYTPIDYANVLVTATSAAGLANTSVSGSVWVSAYNPKKQPAGRRPQDSLTVRVYYEEDPSTIVKEVTFSRADVEAMGTEYHTYTAVGAGSSSFATASGRGVLFSKVLEAAGANLEGISYFSFITADSGGGEWGERVSYSMLFQTRYYFPEFDISGGSVQNAVVVPPMLAIESNFRWYDPSEAGGDLSEDYKNMTDDTCFRLLFGATNTGQITTNKQIYWINTINVVLEGGPAVQPNINGSGDGGGTSGGSTTTGGNATSGTGTDGSTTPGAANGLGAGESGGASAAEGEQSDGTTGDEGRWSVYQIMNRNPSDVDLLDEENPWRPYALPLACGVTAAGAAQAGVWYRRQKRPLRPDAGGRGTEPSPDGSSPGDSAVEAGEG